MSAHDGKNLNYNHMTKIVRAHEGTRSLRMCQLCLQRFSYLGMLRYVVWVSRWVEEFFFIRSTFHLRKELTEIEIRIGIFIVFPAVRAIISRGFRDVQSPPRLSPQ